MESFEPFIQNFLRKNLPNVEIKLYSLAGDASNRRYYRIIHSDSSSVLMRWDPFDPTKYPFLSVQKHFDRNGIRVPQIIAMEPESGLILLEDLGDLTLERKFWENQKSEGTQAFYRLAMDELIRIHFKSTFDKGHDCTAFHIQFDTAKFLWEMNYAKENLLKGILDFKFKTDVEQELDDVFKDICIKLDQEPKFISHRDYHSRNLMIKLDEMCVIDFQDARLGPIQYDLVSLLKDSYIQMPEEMSDELIKYYLEQAKPFLGKNFSKDAFDNIYSVQSIQRCFKACGSFASFYQQREDRRYLKYLSGTLKKVLRSLSGFPEYSLFTDILIDSGALDKDYESL